MVFGSTTSASIWEPYRRAIETMSAVLANRPDLVIKHRCYLDMIGWAEIDPNVKIIPAAACTILGGLPTKVIEEIRLKARIFVDDSLVIALYRAHMEMVLAALIEAIFVVMGVPDTALRQCPLATDKWLELVVGPILLMLGLIIDTNKLTVAIPQKYITELQDLIYTTWHVNCWSFTVHEAQQLTGKLGNLAEGATWVFHLLTHLYASIAKALAGNKLLLSESSREFQDIVESLHTGSFPCSAKDQARHISFALKRSARMVHHSKQKYIIGKDMRREIEFFCKILRPNSGVHWETPIAHIIKRTPSATAYGDSSLEGAGGYSIGLQFWWHIDFPEEVKLRTLLHMKDNKDGKRISINVLEFVTVIINYIASLHVRTTTNIINDPYPVLLNITDNTSSLRWTQNACRTSKLGRLLARFFCSLLIDSPLGINSQWISTTDNFIADDISCLKKLLGLDSHYSFDYSTLQQKYPELKHCSFFQIAPELLSLIWEIVLTEKWPCHEEIRRLKLKPLGRLISSFGTK
jgi:hypothetical protein